MINKQTSIPLNLHIVIKPRVYGALLSQDGDGYNGLTYCARSYLDGDSLEISINLIKPGHPGLFLVRDDIARLLL